MIGIIRNYLFPKKETNDTLKIPTLLVQAFGLPTIVKNCQNTNFEKLILAVDPNLRELSDPFKYLDAYEALILKAKNPLKHLDTDDYELFKHLQKAKMFFVRADELMSKHLLPDAADFYSKGLLIYPFHSYARLNIGYIFRTTGKLDLSEQHYLEGIKHAPDHPTLWSNIGRTYLAKMDKHKAEEAFFRALDLLGGSDNFCISELEKLGSLIRLYTATDHEPPVFVTKDQYLKIIRDNVLASDTIESALRSLNKILLEGYDDLFLELWPIAKKKYFPMKSTWSDLTYLFDGFYARIRKDDSLALSILQSGINHFPQSAFLHSNIGKLQSGQEAIDSFEKAFQLGDCCMGNITLFYDALEKQNGNEHAQQALLNGFEKYGSFEFINFLAHKKFDRGSDEFVSFIMIMIDKIKDPYQKNREQGLLAGLLAEEGHKKAALIILQGLINSDTQEIGIHWNYLLCLKELQQIDKMTEALNNLLAQKWLTDLDRGFLKERLEALELHPTYF